MFKKLDKLLIKAFIGPFIVTFFITLLVLLLQFFWLYIDDFVGKGLDLDIILKFVWYQTASLIPLALPLAFLLSSLMTFGSLGESFELVAIKTAGISLLRFMRPIFIVSLFTCGIAFLFSNYIIPVAFLKSRTLLQDVTNAKPAFDLKEGVFYEGLSGFAIKIGKKEANDSIIRDVIIYEQTNNLQDNFIIAKSGVMRTSDNKRYMEFNLKDGWRYQEKGNGGYNNENTEYIRLGFKEYKKQFDLSSFQLSLTPDSVNRNNEKVYSMRQLNITIDSLVKSNKRFRTQLLKGVYASLSFTKYIDSAKGKKNTDSLHLKKGNADSIRKNIITFDALLPDSAREIVNRNALVYVNSMQTSMTSMVQTIKDKEKILRRHKIEWHRKIVLSLSCIIFFLIGAPLGSIIRKGGLGTPLIAAICFFMVFYFSASTGERFAKEGTSLTPFTGMWMPIFILLPVSIFVTYKAMKDSQLFNKEGYYRFAKRIRNIFIKRSI